MRSITRAVARRIAIPVAAALLATALGTATAHADTGPFVCATATNSATGQSIQVCGAVTGVTVEGGPLQVVFVCYAQSGPVSVTTEVGCVGKDAITGQTLASSSQTAPGDLVATTAPGVDPFDSMAICLSGTAIDASGNTVTLSTTCLT